VLLKITYNCPNKNTRIYSKCSGELHNYLNNNESSLGDFLSQCIQCINSIPNTKYQKLESDYTTLTRFHNTYSISQHLLDFLSMYVNIQSI
jgi:hypothetical protein